MKKTLFLIFILLMVTVFIVGSIANIPQHGNETASPIENKNATVIIGDLEIPVEVVQTPRARNRGLSGRENLPEDAGMYFIFDRPARYSFWMKEMQFAIDIIWIDSSGTIVGIEKSVSPDTYPQGFMPPSPAQFVLEVNAGFSEQNSLTIGDTVVLQENAL